MASLNNNVSVEVRGLEETKRKLEQVAEDIHGKPMVDAMKKSTAIVTRDAKKNLSKPTIGVKFATVNSGQLRNSITPEVYTQNRVLKGVVGSNLKHAPFMELGTGIPAGRPKHVPPLRVLQVWVSQKNRGGKSLNAYVIQQAIARKGGLTPRRYLQRAFEDNQKEINDLFGKTVNAIVNK
jgi:phage gpG-like protein